MGKRESLSAKEAELGEKIRLLRAKAKLRVSDLAVGLGVTESSVKLLQRGIGTQNFLKLAELCKLLNVTPNELLGFNAAGESELVRGALQASYLELGLSETEAKVFAEIVLSVIEGPAIRTAALPPLEAGRALSEFALRQFARTKRS